MKTWLWISWLIASVIGATWFANTLMFSEDKSTLLIGEATHGHHQIELACSSCHTDPFGGKEILQNACLNCHEQELTDAFDSHPKKKFTDPRNADLIEVIDARYCVSCHTEHKESFTHPMGLTLPEDYCFHCHEDIGEERPSHKDLAFDSCASAGCHNFHDNRALYEAFLLEHANEPWLLEIAQLSEKNHASLNAKPDAPATPDPTLALSYPSMHDEWDRSKHAQAGVACQHCHQSDSMDENWLEKPGVAVCQGCHDREAEGFLSGKHGMRLAESVRSAIELEAVRPADGRLTFHENALETVHGCNSCHSAHEFNPQKAATESCLNCHADEHSMAFLDSPHGVLWQQEIDGEIAPGEGVSCATCHMPRIENTHRGTTVVHVEHNQNATLRPNEKMIRPVCMQCHGLAFSIDALADENLIRTNFSGKPELHIPSIDWSVERDKR